MIIREQHLEQNARANRDEIISSLAEYVLSDTILFFSEKEELSARQEKLWRPYINWFNEKTNSSFVVTKSIAIPAENFSLKSDFAKLLSSLSDKKLVSLYAAARELRSVILAFYLLENNDCDVAEILNAAFLEQKFQEEFWGEMPASTEKYAEILSNLNTIKNFLKK